MMRIEIAKTVIVTMELSKNKTVASSVEFITSERRENMRVNSVTALNTVSVSSKNAPKAVLMAMTGRSFLSIFRPLATT